MARGSGVLEYIRLARLQTGAVTAITPVLGYLVIRGAAANGIALVVLFAIGLCMHISGFVLNEYTDIEVDRLSPDLADKPLVKGTISRRAARVMIYASTAMMYVLTLLFFRADGGFALIYLSAAIALSTAYNRFGKRFPGSDVLLASWAFSFCLFGAAIANGGRWLPDPCAPTILGIAGLGFLQVLFNNAVEGGIKDADHDRKGGARTLATALGVAVDRGTITIPRRFASFAWAVKIGHGFLLGYTVYTLWPTITSLSLIWQVLVIGALLLFGAGMYATLARFLNTVEFQRSELKQQFAIHEICTYFLVPVALAAHNGPWITLALVLLPLAWFISLNLILYQQPLEPKV